MSFPSRSGGGGSSYTGSADPNWRYRQLERMGSTAMLMMQIAEQKRRAEQDKLERRIQLASQAVAQGGDLNNPAVQSVLNDMRRTGAKKWGREAGLPEQADLLELAWSQPDPEAAAAAAQAAVQQKIQREIAQQRAAYYEPGPMPQPPNELDLHREAVKRSPVGPQYLAQLAKQSPTGANLLMKEPEPPDAPQGPTEAQRTREYNLAELQSGDPARVNAARRALGDMPDARYPPQGRAGRTPKEPKAPAERIKEISDGLTARLKTSYDRGVAAWEDEAGAIPDSDLAGKKAHVEKRPKPPPVGVKATAVKIHRLEQAGVDEENLAVYEELLAQALERSAVEPGAVEAAWAEIQKELAGAAAH